MEKTPVCPVNVDREQGGHTCECGRGSRSPGNERIRLKKVGLLCREKR